MQETTKPVYDYKELQTFFEDVATPQQIALHLDLLLFYLVCHREQEKEHLDDFFRIYADIFDLKRVLQNMSKPSE